MIRKADIFLAVILIILGLIVSYTLTAGNDAGDTVCIRTGGQLYGYYPLAEDRTVEVSQNGHMNKITIKDKQVSMSFSDCPGQDCVKHSSISGTAETIVCLPNKVTVEIAGGSSGLDTIAR